MRYNPEIKPDYWLVKLDEREYWREDIQSATTEIYGIYLVDRNLHVHICSATPSAELWFIANDPVWLESLSEEKRDELDDAVRSAYDEPVSYTDARDIDRHIEKHPDLAQRLTIDLDEITTAQAAADLANEGWSDGSLSW